MDDPINKLPEELRAKYRIQACVCCDVVECLKVAAALKLWRDRGYRDIEFASPLTFGRKKFFVDVLAKKEDHVVGVVCMLSLHLGWLRWQVKRLRHCLPPSTYFVIVFPSTVGERVDRAAFLADEVWVTSEDNSKVVSMRFISVWHKG
ncbi:MAG: hypothetical protein M1540_01160 [Candidatus Bathyarchaeota archaeon]|nr:hypothetical protein [Candidatus Bathyarchaeota archaeon]